MIITDMIESDITKLHNLSTRHYPEFDCPDFNDGYFSKYVVLNDNRDIILGFGLRRLAEVVLVTDKLQNTTTIGRALVMALGCSIKEARKENIDFLHAFVKDEAYAKHLIQHGFDERVSKTLSLYVKDGK